MNIQARPISVRIVSPSVTFTSEQKSRPVLFRAFTHVLQPKMKRQNKSHWSLRFL